MCLDLRGRGFGELLRMRGGGLGVRGGGMGRRMRVGIDAELKRLWRDL